MLCPVANGELQSIIGGCSRGFESCVEKDHGKAHTEDRPEKSRQKYNLNCHLYECHLLTY